MLSLFREFRFVASQQQVHIAAGVPQRCSQIVGDRIGKRFEFLVRRFQLRRALGDAVFEIGVQPADFFLGELARSDVRNETVISVIAPLASCLST